jgi:hypothetical protein
MPTRQALKRARELWNRSVCAVSLNSPFTAADEKIPLSVVRVNSKPQYIVFCYRFGHQLSKPGHLPVESLKQPCAQRVCAVLFAPKSGQTLKPSQFPARFPHHRLRVDLR